MKVLEEEKQKYDRLQNLRTSEMSKYEEEKKQEKLKREEERRKMREKLEMERQKLKQMEEARVEAERLKEEKEESERQRRKDEERMIEEKRKEVMEIFQTTGCLITLRSKVNGYEGSVPFCGMDHQNSNFSLIYDAFLLEAVEASRCYFFIN